MGWWISAPIGSSATVRCCSAALGCHGMHNRLARECIATCCCAINGVWLCVAVFEEGGILPGPFHGGFGLMTVHGTPKPAYRAFELLHGAGLQRLAVDGTCPCYQGGQQTCDCAPLAKRVLAKDAVPSPAAVAQMATRCTDTLNNTAGGLLATRNASTLRLFLYNHPTMSATTGMTCTMTVQLPASVSSTALARATLARIDETHTNPKAKFKELGEPLYPTPAELDALEAASEVVWGKLSDEQLSQPGPSAVQQFTLAVPANGLAVVDLDLA
jgi:xylan 1,4-beta-xylosidase